MKNIVLLMADQLRMDYMDLVVDGRPLMPNYQRLATEGTVFSECLTSNPICTPARASLLTGKYSHQIGMLSMSGDLSQEHPTYPQALQRAGYATAGIGKFHWLQTWPWGTPRGKGIDLVALAPMLEKYGFDHVWEACGKQLAIANRCDYGAFLEEKGQLEEFRDHVVSRGRNVDEADRVEFTGEPWPFAEADYPDIVITDRMLDWLDTRRQADQPFFLFGSLLSPHAPFDPPASYLEKIPLEELDDFITGEGQAPLDAATKARMYKLRRAYKAMMAVVDAQIGRVLDKLESMGVLDDTVVLFTSDHGEMLGDHGRFQKAIHWTASSRVPAVIRHPDCRGGQRIASPVELTDLTATILDIAGVDARQALARPWPAFQDVVPCRSLLPVMRGETDSIREWAFCECRGEWSMVRSAGFAFVRFHRSPNPDQHRELLFDLRADPCETRNLVKDPAYTETVAWHRNRLLHTLETTPPAQTCWAPLMK